MTDYRLVVRTPSLEEFKTVCKAVGWGDTIPFEQAETALQNSLFCVIVMYGEEPVGIGRVVGDGAIYFYVQDMAVVPEHQGRGLGKLIMDELMRYIHEHASPKSFVALFASPNTPPFYEQFGFNEYDFMPAMVVQLPQS